MAKYLKFNDIDAYKRSLLFKYSRTPKGCLTLGRSEHEESNLSNAQVLEYRGLLVLGSLLSNLVWDIVVKWEWFSRRVVGIQYTKAVDSISAIIAEGFGRHFKKDKIHFYRMSRGSVTESLDWTEKSKIRKLLKEEDYLHILSELQELPREINQLIKYTNTRLKE